ncbi:hypothetical protein CROQUDRAFT_663059 [Cronartium quercuum f. sp. fusiforme G11]|uniref:Uncharacterized protein n=1 Tax=Cronartium quercuum f. sp. fusiforme G11 TaxID=708437 RepID=A0A9P6T7Y6_9BASI|nr:hypothetical protein CROQUDRAFT_663059 [Cronartium quercuum f. sp. fusiforme G11]
MTTEIAGWWMGLRSKLLSRNALEDVQRSVDGATEEAFKTLSTTTPPTTSNPTAPIPSTSSSIIPTPSLTSSTTAPTHFDLHNLRSSLFSKPTPSSSSFSLDTSNTSLRVPRARRPSSPNKTTSISKKPSASASTRKPAGVPKASNSILKSRTVAPTGVEAGTSVPKAVVRWRDEASEGQAHLESFEESTMTTDPSVSMDSSMLLLNQSPLKPLVPSIFTNKPSDSGPSSTTISNKSSNDSLGSSSNRSSHLKPGYLSRRQSTRPLASLDEEGEETGNEVLKDTSNVQLPSQPLKKARRESSIGPIRNAPRRQSLSLYHRRPRDSLSVNGMISNRSSNLPNSAPSPKRVTNSSNRRVSLLPVPSNNHSVIGQRNGIPGPAWR